MQDRKRSERHLNTLADIVAAGGRVHRDELRRITMQHGLKYANGLFGGRCPSLVSDGDMRLLTEQGRRLLGL